MACAMNLWMVPIANWMMCLCQLRFPQLGHPQKWRVQQICGWFRLQIGSTELSVLHVCAQCRRNGLSCSLPLLAESKAARGTDLTMSRALGLPLSQWRRGVILMIELQASTLSSLSMTCNKGCGSRLRVSELRTWRSSNATSRPHGSGGWRAEQKASQTSRSSRNRSGGSRPRGSGDQRAEKKASQTSRSSRNRSGGSRPHGSGVWRAEQKASRTSSSKPHGGGSLRAKPKDSGTSNIPLSSGRNRSGGLRGKLKAFRPSRGRACESSTSATSRVCASICR